MKTCIITNNWIDNIHPSTEHPFYQYADCVLESSKLGMRKPDNKLYTLACERLSVSPTEVSTSVCIELDHLLHVKYTSFPQGGVFG